MVECFVVLFVLSLEMQSGYYEQNLRIVASKPDSMYRRQLTHKSLIYQGNQIRFGCPLNFDYKVRRFTSYLSLSVCLATFAPHIFYNFYNLLRIMATREVITSH